MYLEECIMYQNRMPIECLVGRIIQKLDMDCDQVRIEMEDSSKYIILHEQECCEYVEIDRTEGNVDDIIGIPIFGAVEYCPEFPPKDAHTESHTWTVYEITSLKGTFRIYWYGTSNGYYGEVPRFNHV